MRVFFDVDGVLVNGFTANVPRPAKWSNNIQADLGVRLEDFERHLFRPKDDQTPPRFHACLKGERDIEDALAEILPLCGYSGHPEAIITYWLEKDSDLNQPLLNFIKTLQQRDGLNLHIASGQERRRATYLWNDLELSQYFDGAYWTCDMGVLKYGTAFFEALNEQLGLDIAKDPPLFFDDRPNVVSAAQECGWDAVMYTRLEDVTLHPRLSG